MKIWEKGIATDEKMQAFTVGNDRELDLYLAKYDVRASMAHAKMLGSVGLLEPDEVSRLLDALSAIAVQIENNCFVIDEEFEDMHSKIEFLLIEKLGETGKKIHMGRSRNDQVLVALHLYFKDELDSLKGLIKMLFELLIRLAETHKEVFMPGYTHMQIAMPSSFGLWFSAYAESLIDDVCFLNTAYQIADQNPLGSAAGYGSSLPLDRSHTTKSLGFSQMKYNVIAAQMSRGKTEKSVANTLCSIAATLSKLAMDICLYAGQDYNFFKFPDRLTTGSSIMPHKKNPDLFELIRGKCNQIQGVPQQLQFITTNLPSGYHRELQLTKAIIIPAIEEVKSCLEMMHFALKDIEVRTDILNSKKYDYLFSVDSLNALVKTGIPFRDAYKKLSQDIAKGDYRPVKDSFHTHEGSLGNLCLDAICLKMEGVLYNNEFKKPNA